MKKLAPFVSSQSGMEMGASCAAATAATSAGTTPRTPHSPSDRNGSPGSMASPRPAALAVRPVTARTWQALAGVPQAAPIGDTGPRRVTIFNNDLYHGPEEGPTSPQRPAARPASPLYQPASARPGTPTIKSVERLQQQRIATPSCLASEGAATPCGWQQGGSSSGADVLARGSPTLAAATADGHAAPGPAMVTGPVTGCGSDSLQPPELQMDRTSRHGTSPPRRVISPLRTSAVSIPLLQQQPQVRRLQRQGGTPCSTTSQGSSLAADSSRGLCNFAGAVAAGGSSCSGASGSSRALAGSPQFGLPGKLGGDFVSGHGSSSSDRPSTPCFQPIALSARPATAQPAPSSPAAAQFTIKAAHLRANSGSASWAQAAISSRATAGGPAGAYPQPPLTAPPRAGLQGSIPYPIEQPLNGSLASFGISAAAFVAVMPKPVGAAKVAAAVAPGDGLSQDGKATLHAPTQAALLAMANLSSKADLRRFLLMPGPADKPLCCKIVRCSGGLLKGSPQYTLLVEQEGGKTGAFLAAARKRKGGPGGATYVLSVDQHDISQHSASYVGKLRSNFLGTEFAAYDGGTKASKGGAARCELSAALYQTNVLGTKGPRKMTVLIPKLEEGGQRPLALSPKGEHDTLLGQYKSYNLSSCVVLRNKPPRWNQCMGAYCLNFGGRVTQASVKNFQLVSVDNMERTILQFGKVADDVFTMDYSYPMTALQAFAICLSSFASKLATQ